LREYIICNYSGGTHIAVTAATGRRVPSMNDVAMVPVHYSESPRLVRISLHFSNRFIFRLLVG